MERQFANVRSFRRPRDHHQYPERIIALANPLRQNVIALVERHNAVAFGRTASSLIKLHLLINTDNRIGIFRNSHGKSLHIQN